MPCLDSAGPTYRPAFSVDSLDRGEVHVVTVTGELDLRTAPALAVALEQAPPKPAVVDLTDCTFLDAAGLHVLLEHRARPSGIAVACRPGGPPARLIGLTVRSRLRSFPTLEQAMDALAA